MAGDNNSKNSSNKEPLLKNHRYHENCPGCKVDQAKEMYQGMPIKNLLNVWILTLSTVLPISCLFPFLYFMVRDFGIAKTEADISTYAGYVGFSFPFARSLTSLPWGMIADRYGRKYAIVTGLASVVVFNTLFGLSTTLWMAIGTRLILGCLNASLGPIKAYATELFREEHQAIGLSSVSAAWGLGLVIGPAIGGYLSQPVEKYPHVFPKGSLFDKFPYFLPCFVISAFALAVLVGCIWLPETLHKHDVSDESNEDAEALENEITGKILQKDESLLLNWPFMSVLISYCIFSLYDVAYSEVFSLWAVSPQKLGGLNYATNNVGNVLSISGFSMLIFQILLYPLLEKVYGAVGLARISAVMCIPILQSHPFIALLSGFTRDLLITIASVLMYCLTATILTGLFIMQNRAVEQHQRGLANGIAMTGMSLFKSFGPAGGGAILSWSQKRLDASFLPGPHMVFFVLNLIAALGVLMLFKPFLVERKETPSEQLQ
ncbi:hypothetical protein QN277_001994 [Acacia crassicarpa]|uniref:Major facilitator superfamily (MFS) profile domain-containing protein n=1 Tax=Acacia crassicarpa TaxID=499986 RepID=A0AAE1N9V3_9FABA|nr:hypothetical protein QN277_001994 [Acacia crassicarpa]